MSGASGKILLLFDLDGTLTRNRLEINEEVRDELQRICKVTERNGPKYLIAIVSGSDYASISRQIGNSKLEKQFRWLFTENGLLTIHHELKDGSIGQRIEKVKDLVSFVGEDKLKEIINFCLRYIADLDIPIKRGNFIDFRNGMINVSPIGRSCSLSERLDFFEYDKVHKIRVNFLKKLEEKFPDFEFKIGGQISIDMFPKDWNKTICLSYLEKQNLKEIHFFGDQCVPGGNDYEIFVDGRVQFAHRVKDYTETLSILKKFK